MANEQKVEIAYLGAGCFWCIEAIYQRLKGVLMVEPGYAGGNTTDPTYEEVCSGKTGHIEIAKITFDSTIISFDELLEVFWSIHDPTSMDRQGNDSGSQYRSVIFFTSEQQKLSAEKSKEALQALGEFSGKVVTEIRPLNKFYPAENYHRDYFNNHSDQPYCRLIIAPKLAHFKERFQSKINLKK